MARALRSCTPSLAATTEVILTVWFFLEIHSMGQQISAVRMVARCSPSTPTARALRSSTPSRLGFLYGVRQMLAFIPTTMALVLTVSWFCLATPFMGRRVQAVLLEVAPFSDSLPMGQVSLLSTLSRRAALIPRAIIPTAAGFLRLA